LQLFIAVYISR